LESSVNSDMDPNRTPRALNILEFNMDLRVAINSICCALDFSFLVYLVLVVYENPILSLSTLFDPDMCENIITTAVMASIGAVMFIQIIFKLYNKVTSENGTMVVRIDPSKIQNSLNLSKTQDNVGTRLNAKYRNSVWFCSLNLTNTYYILVGRILCTAGYVFMSLLRVQELQKDEIKSY